MSKKKKSKIIFNIRKSFSNIIFKIYENGLIIFLH